MLLTLIGGEATGKSTLAAALASHLDAQVVPEVLRAFVDDRGRVPRADEQLRILQVQAAAERRALATGLIVIGDPDPVMTAVYSQLYYDDASLFDAAEIMSLPRRLVIWCDTDAAWQADGGQRDGVAFRDSAHTIIKAEVIPRFSNLGVDVLKVTGPVDARLRMVLEHLDQGVAPLS